MVWTAETERLINDWKSGRLEIMKDDLDNVVIDFQENDYDAIKQGWEKILGFEEMARMYSQAAMGLESFEEIDVVRKASQDIAAINSRIRVKKACAEDYIDSQVIAYHKRLDGINEKGSMPWLQESKSALMDVQEAARAIGYLSGQEHVASLEQLYDQRIKLLLRADRHEKEEEVRRDDEVLQKKKYLSGQARMHDLRKHKSRLEHLLLLEERAPRREKIEELIATYNVAIENKSADRKAKGYALIKWAAAAMIASTIMYAGYRGIKGAGTLAQTQVASIKNKRFEERLEAYAAEINKQKQALTMIEQEKRARQEELTKINKAMPQQQSQVDQAGVFLTGRTNKQGRANANASLMDHLRNVLPLAEYTLYIDKSDNITYLLQTINGTSSVLTTLRHTDSSRSEPKTREGQRGTPEGVYHIDSFEYFGDRKNKSLGRGFWHIDYPNAHDQSKGYTGSGVGICSASNERIKEAISSSQDVMHSCIALTDPSFEKLRSYIGNGHTTQVVIEDEHRPLGELR